MNEFWKTPEGKILSYGIHEHNSGLGMINNNLFFCLRQIENGNIKIEGDKKDVDYFINLLKKVKEVNKVKCRDAVDYIYTGIKKIKENE